MRHSLMVLAGLCMSTVFILPSWASDNLEGGKKIEGTVSAVSESSVVVNTPTEGSQTYSVEPDWLSSLQLQPGDAVLVDTTRLETGTIRGIDSYTVKIELDNGETRSFILDREGRKTFGFGDRVAITPKDYPSRCQRLYRLETYKLRPGEILKVVVYEPQVTVAPVVPSPPPVAPPPVVAPEPPIPAPTVPGLW
ncbi:hypothetical protein [Lyngbya confervoides]|uniref:DUF5666 domain-containing protein n=1 Tax=Lyngbya confervoides BDU141951 TaxID=1574623 RepID=A0ABD4T0W7_9CYAN|nr:hypothetical protein [Lyngbya confervoides]MCM1982299.1 hypothetical protein [Lyngbya confervoides BDU141951]